MVNKKKYVIGMAVVIMAMPIIIKNYISDKNSEFIHETVEVYSLQNIKEVVYGGLTSDGFYYASNKNGITLYYQKDEANIQPQMLMESDEAFMIDMYVFDNKLIYEEALFSDNGIITNLYYISKDGECELLFSELGCSMAYTCICGDFLLVNEDKLLSDSLHKSEIFRIDLKEKKYEVLFSTTYTVNSEGLCQGDNIVYLGGNNDYIFFQVITMDNEFIETARETHLYKYSTKKGKVVGKYPLEKKVLHINGLGNVIIISEYDYFQPLTNSGKILKEVDGELRSISEIEGIQSGDDIIKSYVVGNRIFFYNNQYYYVYDILKDKLSKYTYNDFENEQSRVVLNQEGLSYLEKDRNGVKLHKVFTR